MASKVTEGNTLPRARKWEGAFLTAFRNSCNVRHACEKAGVSRKVAYQHRNEDPRFAALWKEAEQDAIDVLEARAWERSKVSDTILTLLLKAHRPRKYRETISIKVVLEKAQEVAKKRGLDPQKMVAAAERIVLESMVGAE